MCFGTKFALVGDGGVLLGGPLPQTKNQIPIFGTEHFSKFKVSFEEFSCNQFMQCPCNVHVMST